MKVDNLIMPHKATHIKLETDLPHLEYNNQLYFSTDC